MITCQRCGAQSADGASTCSKCGVALVHQYQNIADNKRARVGTIFRSIIWVAVIILAIIFGPPNYHRGMAAYMKYNLKASTDRITRDCGGPIDENSPAELKAQVEKCVDGNTDLQKQKKDVEEFTKNDPPDSK